MTPIKRLRVVFILAGSAFVCFIQAAQAFAFVDGSSKADEIARNSDFVIVRMQPGQTVEDIAQRYLGASNQAWQLYELNGYGSRNRTMVAAGELLAVPVKPVNQPGVFRDGYRAIPILCYHQFSPGATARNQLAVSAQAFEDQLAYLANNGFQVIALTELDAILSRKQPVPDKTVVLTIDDGYRSIYTIAYPLLRKYNFPATVFLYTDFVGGTAALSWQQLKEMQDSGLIDVQSHTKSHASLAITQQDANQRAYQARVHSEISDAERALEQHLGAKPRYLSYPYGDTSDYTASALKQSGYALAVTVERGPNPAFSDPYRLRRTMIFNNHDLDDFKQFVRGYVAKALP